MSFEEKLIKLVRQYPYLYDRRAKGHKDTVKCEETWERIAKDLGIEGRGDKAKGRWATLRQTFSKQLKKRKYAGASEASNPLRWKYYEQLHFLKEHMSNRDTHTHFPCPVEDTKEEDACEVAEVNSKKEMLESEEDISNYRASSELSFSGASGSSEPWAKKRKSSPSPMPDPLAESKHQCTLSTPKLPEQHSEHEADVFAKLVAASLTKLSSLRRLRAKRAIHAILCDLEEEEILQAV